MEWSRFLEICKRLNEAGARYVVVGGFAVLLHGYERTTRDVDYIVDVSPENIAKIRRALRDILPEAVTELADEDVAQHIVVRLIGEGVVVDLMKSIGDIDYAALADRVEWHDVEGLRVPVADLDAMIQCKQSYRDKDREDLLFLQGKKAYLEKIRK